jgi:hypothetical protein
MNQRAQELHPWAPFFFALAASGVIAAPSKLGSATCAPRFTSGTAEIQLSMSVALALALTGGSLAAAALSIAYALVHR